MYQAITRACIPLRAGMVHQAGLQFAAAPSEWFTRYSALCIKKQPPVLRAEAAERLLSVVLSDHGQQTM